MEKLMEDSILIIGKRCAEYDEIKAKADRIV